MFAVIASGNYYVPIDINYPIARKNYLLKNSDAKLWISDVKTESERAVNNIIYVSLEEKEICVEENRMRAPNIENIAYCIYTSGSTGNPKGVMIKEKSLLEFVVEFSKVVSVDECENVLCSTTQIFDIFFVESILALIKGKTVILTQEDEGRNPKVLLDIIEQNNVDMIQMTPSRIRMIFNSNLDLTCLKKLKCILIGGEQFPEELFDKLSEVSNAHIYNLYGPTEATIWCSAGLLSKDNEITIGCPFKNADFLIWNNNQEVLEDEITGELLIGGNCLADSYFKATSSMKEKFIMINNKRYFRTGDLATHIGWKREN